jgi:hypothetical protein
VHFDSAQALQLLADVLLDLGSAQPQHPAQLLDRDSVVEHLADLLQAEADVTQGDDAVQPVQLMDAVAAVTVGRVDPIGPEQADLVVVAQHAWRHLSEPGELSDVQHDDVLDTPSHRVKVKRFCPRHRRQCAGYSLRRLRRVGDLS